MEYCVEFFVCRSAIKHVNTKNSVNDKLIMVSYFSSILLPLLVALFLSSWKVNICNNTCCVPQVKSVLRISHELRFCCC